MITVQRGVQNRHFLYSSLGRMLRVRQPEQDVNAGLTLGGHPTNSTWTAAFAYDDTGNVVTATDAKNITITNNDYDALNRPATRSYSDGITPTVYFAYDQYANAKGKLTSVNNGVSESRYTQFDILGRLTQYQQITDGEFYTSSYQYNASGALLKETYPSGRTVETAYDNDGDISQVFGKPTSSAPTQTYADNFTYFPDRKIASLRLGNNLWESAKLNSRLQVTEIAMGSTIGDGSLMKLEYAYGELQPDGVTVNGSTNAGNIAKQTISYAGQSAPFVQTYRYDSLDRITEAIEKVNGTQTWKQTFGYDIYGNRNARYQIVGSAELPINNLTLPSVDQNRNRFNLGQGYSYDANGNIVGDLDLTTGQGRTFIFNGDNKQTEVKNPSNVTIGTYAYDGNGKRVKKINAQETTVFVYDGMGKLVAEYSTATPPPNPTIRYTATDTLGSPRVITDGSGQVESRRDFMPFGEELFADGTYRSTTAKYSTTGFDAVRQRFTGYQRDAESSLDFAEARYYQTSHGRFTAVDPLLASGKSADPQTFNRYVYVMNNPLTLVDPTGLQAGTTEDEGIFARIHTAICKSFWCKVKEGIKDGFNMVARAVMGTAEKKVKDEESEVFDPLGVEKQVGHAINNYSRDLNKVTDAVVENDPTGVANVARTTVNHSLNRASGDDVLTSYGSAALGTTTTLAPAGKLFAAPKMVKHHIFNAFRGSSPASEPFRQFFGKHGIKVDDFLVEIPEAVHKKFIHGAGNNWTTRWKEWIKANPNATTKEVYQFAGQLMDEYGLSGVPFVR